MARIQYEDYDDGNGDGNGDDSQDEAPPQQASPPPDPRIADPNAEGPGVNEMIDRDKASWEARLRQEGGNLFDASDLEGMIRQVSYARNEGRDPADFLNAQIATYNQRRSNRPGGSGPAQNPPPSGPSGPTVQAPPSPWEAAFNDPRTRQYEQLLQAQLDMYRAQQAEMQRAAEEARQRRSATAAAVDRVTGYTNQRIAKLQGPAYTGSEQEVLRTQLLDPLERDRHAARQRALEQIAARGMDPRSGIAQELLLQVDRAFDEHRTRAQGSIASRQIEEQRSREQEAQQLLQYLAMLPDAVARGDLDFVSYVQGLINQPGQQGLTVAQLLSDLPRERLYDALATLGISPSMSGTSASLLGLLNNQQQNRLIQNQLGAGAWQNIGRSFFPG